jgi:hypothetical protein
VRAVRAAGPEGVRTWRAPVVIDATGDGDAAALAGAEFTFGREFKPFKNSLSRVKQPTEKHRAGGFWDSEREGRCGNHVGEAASDEDARDEGRWFPCRRKRHRRVAKY